MISKKTFALCPRCGKPLWTSDIDGYKYVCFDCNENFYGIEVKERQTDDLRSEDMEAYCNTFSNKRFSNIPLTVEQFGVVDFVAFESETALVYPFAVGFNNMTFEMVNDIVKGCNGHTSDIDTLYEECEKVLGINPELLNG